ncbi:MAG TPA: clostripain-related cysteine peptidase [Promineifilum sp.]|nr:clostripain-related cysteine peptidase [Promineifilum sp.]
MKKSIFQPSIVPVLAPEGATDNDIPFIYMASGGQQPRRRIIGQRRRPGSDRPSSGRADAPHRDDRPASSGGGYSQPTGGGYTGGGYSGGGLGGFPGGTRGAAGGGGILLFLCAAIAYFLFGGGGDGGGILDTGQVQQDTSGQSSQVEDLGSLADEVSSGTTGGLPTVAPLGGQTSSTTFQGSGGLTAAANSGEVTGAAAASLPAAANSTVTDGQTWTILLYQDADDKVLEQDIFIDFNEAERVGSTDRVKLVAQMDRYQGGFSGDGNWTDTRRYLLQQDDNLDSIASPYESIGEVDMSDPQELVNFVTWGIQNFPADKYVLIMSDHGMGWPGGWTDAEPRSVRRSTTPLAQAIGDAMYLQDIDAALQTIRDQTGLDAFELIGMDACLMGHMEVFTMLAPHARFAVASQEVEPAVGWAYTAFLSQLAQNPDVTGRELGQWIVDTYIVGDQRVQDPQARAAFVGGRGATAEQVAAQLEQSVTLAAVDLSQMPAANDGLNRFALYLRGMDQRQVAQARSNAQSFTSIFGQQVPASYIDLPHFAALLVRQTGDAQLRSVVEDMFGAFQNAVIAEKSGRQKPGATGLSIYFPNSQLYASAAAGPQSYIPITERFANVSLWDDYLTYHYTGRSFQDNAGSLAIPDRGATITAPGAGAISLSPLSVSDTTVAPGGSILMSADVDGDNIGYIYLFAGFYDRDANSVNVIDTDYIDSGDTREMDGIFYPDWGEGAFTLEFEWEPIVFAIDDGQNQVLALLQPQTYGAAPEDAVYAVDGLYTFSTGEQRFARALFSNESLQQVITYQTTDNALPSPNDVKNSPRVVTPQAGDQFTVLELWYDLDDTGQLVDAAYEPGGTLTFGQGLWTYTVQDAPAGDYTIGFIVEDLDGNRTETYADVTVQ